MIYPFLTGTIFPSVFDAETLMVGRQEVIYMSLFSSFLFVFCDLVYLINLISFDLIRFDLIIIIIISGLHQKE